MSVFSDYYDQPFSDLSRLANILQEPNCEERLPRLPLFSRCPITNEARLEDPIDKLEKDKNRIPLFTISNNGQTWDGSTRQINLNNLNQQLPRRNYESLQSKAVGARRAAPALATMPPKPSLNDVRDNSIVALTNKYGAGKYWFKSACPMPDPRWDEPHQLMIGPIPGDVEYSQLRKAFLDQGHTLHLFIQNNQAWLEKNQEKFGNKHVKFGYVVYTDREVAARLLALGYVLVGNIKVGVKKMDGRPAAHIY